MKSSITDTLYHLSFNRSLPETLTPRLPDGWEDGNGEFTTPRVSFSTNILGAVRAIWPNIDHIWRGSPDGWLTIHVYQGQLQTQRVLWTQDLVKDRLVFDAHMTDEVCVLDPIEVQYVKTIRIRPKGRPQSFREYNDPRGANPCLTQTPTM